MLTDRLHDQLARSAPRGLAASTCAGSGKHSVLLLATLLLPTDARKNQCYPVIHWLEQQWSLERTNEQLQTPDFITKAVHLTDKLQYKATRRYAYNRFWQTNLFNIALAHYYDAVSQFYRLFLIVG